MQRIAIAPHQLQEKQILLTPQQQHYLRRVLRLGEGDRFIAINKGTWWLAQLKQEQAEVLESLTTQTELAVSVTLMVALPKGNGFDEVVRCCTELGVSCFVPVISDRTLLNPSSQKLQRWQRIAQEATEQSERSFVPTILESVAFCTALATVVSNHKYICVPRGDAPHLLTCLQATEQSAIVIATGPEGGWTQKEVEVACLAGFKAVSLGKRILRAITAPVVAMSLVAAANET